MQNYNPLHRGHEYQFKRTRELLGEDTGFICLIDGNFVSGVSPCLTSRRGQGHRSLRRRPGTGTALPYALSSAEGFAFGAVSLLNKLKCVDYLSFGSELGDIAELSHTAELLLRPEMDELIRNELKKAYPMPWQDSAQRRLLRQLINLLTQRNNILVLNT